MAHRIADRIKELSSTTGTGSFTLTGAISGFFAFCGSAPSPLQADGDTTWYCAQNGSEWEIGLGTRSSSGVLARTTILGSSNSGSAVSFTSGPTVFCDVPAAALPVAGPAFRGHRTTAQSVTTLTVTKVQITAKDFDTAGAFDAVTNYRFQPLVAGYYQASWIVVLTGAASGVAFLRKNGSDYSAGSFGTASSGQINSSGADLVYLNGSTDYIELFVYATASGTLQIDGTDVSHCVFSAHLSRTA